VQQAQRLVTLRDVRDDDAERHDVGELLERHVLRLHLAPDRIGHLLATGNLRRKSALLQRLHQLDFDLRHQLVAALAQIALSRQHRRSTVGIELAEGQLLEFPLHLLHADARGERRIKVHGLARDAPAPRRLLDVMQRAHVVQAVGQLHQQHADVRRHGQHQLAQVLGFLGAFRLDLEARELGDAVDQPRDVLAEQAGDLVARGVGVFERVVQQAGHDRGGVEPHL
jgi:hypothetical protein